MGDGRGIERPGKGEEEGGGESESEGGECWNKCREE